MPRLAIATFNTHWAMDRAGTDIDLLEGCKALDADVIALQEAWRPRGAPAAHVEVAQTLGYRLVELQLPRRHNRHAPARVRSTDGEDGSWWGLALLTRLPVLATRSVALGRVPLDDADRRALQVELAVDGSQLVVTTVHLTHRLWGSVWHLLRLSRFLPSPEVPAVTLGDFNMWGPVVQALMPGCRRAARGRTWPAPRPHSQIDHLLVNRPLRVAEAAVGEFRGSDHLPLRAVVEW